MRLHNGIVLPNAGYSSKCLCTPTTHIRTNGNATAFGRTGLLEEPILSYSLLLSVPIIAM